MGRNDEIRNRLESLAEPEFQRFASSLIPDLKPGFLLGVRLPKLRKISREIAGNDPQGYLKEARSDSFEEIMLQGMVIGCIPGKPEQVFPLIEDFLPKIDNWSICDSFCSSLKIAREYPEAYMEAFAAAVSGSTCLLCPFRGGNGYFLFYPEALSAGDFCFFR